MRLIDYVIIDIGIYLVIGMITAAYFGSRVKSFDFTLGASLKIIILWPGYLYYWITYKP